MDVTRLIKHPFADEDDPVVRELQMLVYKKPRLQEIRYIIIVRDWDQQDNTNTSERTREVSRADPAGWSAAASRAARADPVPEGLCQPGRAQTRCPRDAVGQAAGSERTTPAYH